MTTYTITAAQRDSLLASRLQHHDRGDSGAAEALDWALALQPDSVASADLSSVLATAQRAGIAHNNGAGGQYLLCATEQQLLAFAAALGSAAPSTAEPVATYSMDVDPQGIRALVADAITGAIALGAQNEAPAPTGHWLAPFWNIGREAGQWRANVWEIARALKCLPSTYADANGHVLRAAEKLTAAHQAASEPVAPQAARDVLAEPKRCSCGATLTADELHYYGVNCESCEAAQSRAMEADMLGAAPAAWPAQPQSETAPEQKGGQ